MNPRKILPQLEAEIIRPAKKIIFLWGPRQTGKSTILNHLRQKHGGAYFNFDDLNDQKLFVPELEKLKSVIDQKIMARTRVSFLLMKSKICRKAPNL